MEIVVIVVIYCRSSSKYFSTVSCPLHVHINSIPWRCVYVAHSPQISTSPKLKTLEGLAVIRLFSDDLIKAGLCPESLPHSVYASSLSAPHIYCIGWKEWKFKVVLLGLMCFILSAHDAWRKTCVCSLYNTALLCPDILQCLYVSIFWVF